MSVIAATKSLPPESISAFSRTLGEAALMLPAAELSLRKIEAGDDARGDSPTDPDKEPAEKPEREPDGKSEPKTAYEPVVVDTAGQSDKWGELARFSIQLHPPTDPNRQYVLFTNPPKDIITSIKLEKPVSEADPKDPKGAPLTKVHFTSLCGKEECDKGHIVYDGKGNPVEVVFTTDNGKVLEKRVSRPVMKLDHETAKETVEGIDMAFQKFLRDNPKHEAIAVFMVSDGAVVPDGYLVTQVKGGEKHLFRLREKVYEVPIVKETATGPGRASLTLEGEKVSITIRNPAMIKSGSRLGTVTTARGTKPLIDLAELIAEIEKEKQPKR